MVLPRCPEGVSGFKLQTEGAADGALHRVDLSRRLDRIQRATADIELRHRVVLVIDQAATVAQSRRGDGVAVLLEKADDGLAEATEFSEMLAVFFRPSLGREELGLNLGDSLFKSVLGR